VNGPNVHVPALTVTSYYVGVTVATPVTGLRMGASWDYLDPHQQPYQYHVNDIYAMSVAGYLSYQATEKLSFHARAEYFKDKGGILFGQNDTALLGRTSEVLALTGTVQYDLWKNVISRVEVRWDHSLHDIDLFGGTTDDPNLKNAVMLAANVIYKF
jgi:hypothetical protein